MFTGISLILYFNLLFFSLQAQKDEVLTSFPDKEKKQIFGSCKVSKTKTFWGCELSHVFFGDISYQGNNQYYTNTDFSYFQSGVNEIFSPLAFMDYLNDTIFYPFINRRKCDYESVMYRTNFYCDCSIIDQLPKLNFVFDSYSYSIPMNKLFKEHHKKCLFLITNDIYDDDHWILGKQFLQNYESSFDFQEKSVSFFSNRDNIEYIDIDRLFPYKKITRIGGYTMCIALIIALALLIFKFTYDYIFKLNKTKISTPYSEQKQVELI